MKIPIILVALKTDLRTDTETLKRLATMGQSPITPQEGQKVANKIGAYKYVECSALSSTGVTDVFNAAAEASILPLDSKKPSKPKKKACHIM